VRILVVDDDPQIQDLFRYYLDREGFEVSVGSDGEEALDLLGSSRYDLAILDILLPRMHGLKTLSRLREMEGPVGRTPVILVTGVLVGDAYREEALRQGADDFFTKPVDMDDLLAAVRRVAGQALEV